MPAILVQHHVKNFAEWKMVFDSMADLRASNGEHGAQIFRSESDPNQITVITKWDSLENARKYSQAPELKAAMEKGGVDSQPSISFLNEA